MSQRFTVTAGDIQGEVNQLFEGDEATPSASDAAAAEGSGRDVQRGSFGCSAVSVCWKPTTVDKFVSI
ncbi:hypothetical protein DPX16_4099 [Anabarilius grahami]|uniref:Uncharacterized protein n=1 Tax=Anabarilius grahami TaxID=495550 RepID=A0A3N0XYU9_ANAGA|nr:hypothetical protein DPX16_4099 [Anabarilius grahami]